MLLFFTSLLIPIFQVTQSTPLLLLLHAPQHAIVNPTGAAAARNGVVAMARGERHSWWHYSESGLQTMMQKSYWLGHAACLFRPAKADQMPAHVKAWWARRGCHHRHNLHV